MALTAEQRTYMEEVLGVSEVMLPKDVTLHVPKFHQEGQPEASILFVTKEVWGQEERLIFDKMIGAMKLKEFYLLQVSPEDAHEVMEPFAGTHAVVFGEEDYSHIKPKLRWSKTYALSELTRFDEGLQNRKRETWGQLKKVLQDVESVH